jgi:hypothetical protein
VLFVRQTVMRIAEPICVVPTRFTLQDAASSDGDTGTYEMDLSSTSHSPRSVNKTSILRYESVSVQHPMR